MNNNVYPNNNYQCCRFFSFFEDVPDYGANNNNARNKHQTKNSSPSYKVYGETAALTLNVIPPTFKHLGKNSIVLDSNRKGRLLLDFTPRKTGNESCTYNTQA